MKITKDFTYLYAIVAKNSGSGSVYYVNSATHGEHMGEYSNSLAYQFNRQKTARDKIAQLKIKHKGLIGWKLEWRKFN